MRHSWGCTCVLIQKKDSPLSNLSPSIQMKKKHCGKRDSECFLSKCCRCTSISAAAITACSVSHVNLGRWACYFPSLLLNMRRAIGAWSCFWECLARLSLLAGWRDVPKCHRCLARCGFAAPAESVFSYAGLHMEEGSIWCVNGIPAQPLPPRCRAQSQEVVCRGGEHARETALPRLCSLGQDPQILAPLCLF